MRILTLANTPLNPETGSGYVVCGYTERLRRLGADVELKGPSDFEPLHKWRRAISYRQALGMAMAARKSEHDIIEFYGAEAWLAIRILSRRRSRPLLVCHSNGLETHCSERLAAVPQGTPYARRTFQPRMERVYERAFRQCDGIVTVGQFDADYALARGYVRPSRLLAIDNPLPEPYLDLPLVEERGATIGFCGSWLPRKGTACITHEVTEVLRRHPAWRFLLVGVGSGFRAEEHFPRDVITQLDVVAHAERTEELRSLYQRVRILVMPSLYESFGLVAAEGMASGCALVVTPVGFGAALRSEEEALVISGEDGALGEALERLIGNDDLRRRIARGGHRRVQGLRWEPAAQVLYETYSRWLEEHRRAQ